MPAMPRLSAPAFWLVLGTVLVCSPALALIPPAPPTLRGIKLFNKEMPRLRGFPLLRRLTRPAALAPKPAEPSAAAVKQDFDYRRLWRRRELARIFAFALPALSIPLADPIMSCVDAICVGQYATTLELAALGPNLVIFNFCFFTFQFLAIGTTLRVSSALANGDLEAGSKMIATSLQIAVVAGLAMAGGLAVWGREALALTGAVPEILEMSRRYLEVRIWAMPAVLGTMVLQSGLLAQQDSVTCLVAVLVSSAFNILGDVLLIVVFNMGLAGAAWATALGNVLAFGMLLVLGYMGRGEAAEGKLRVQWRHVPSREELNALTKALGPLFFLATGKNICYLLIQSASTSFSTLTCAAHQAMWSIWAVLSFAGTPLEQSAQVFLPRHIAKDFSDMKRQWRERRSEDVRNFFFSREFTKTLIVSGVIFGSILGTMGWAMPHAPQIFSSDPQLYPIMLSFWPYMALSLGLGSMCNAMEGCLMALGDLKFLCGVTGALMIAVFGMLQLYVLQPSVGIIGVWQAVLFFFAFRFFTSIARIFRLKGILGQGFSGSISKKGKVT